MSHLRVCRIAATMALSLVSVAAVAATTTATFQVSATVAAACTVSASPMNFGSFSSLTSVVDTTTSVTVNCVSGTTWLAGIDLGTGAGASLASRKLTGGANILDYNIFRDAARTQVMGGFVTGGNVLGGTGTGLNDVQTLYGRIPANATTPPAGTYTDLITVTVQF